MKQIEELLFKGHREKVFSAGSVGIVSKKGLWQFQVGQVSWQPSAPPVTPETWYDLASLTKVFSTTTIFARLYEKKVLDLDEQIAKLFPELPWNEAYRTITVEDLLAHKGGVKSWSDFRNTPREGILSEIVSSPPAAPPTTVRIYSDLGFIVLGEWLVRKTKMEMNDLFQKEVAEPLKLSQIAYEPLRHGILPSQIAATEEVAWRGGLVQGVVHDDNAYLLGKPQAHAGLFGTIYDCVALAKEWADGLRGKTGILSSETVREFVKRGLGWDRPTPPSSGGDKISSRAIGHLGYTGTSVWIDPGRDAVVVLLTNRIHPSSTNEAIKTFRPMFHDAIWGAIDQ